MSERTLHGLKEIAAHLQCDPRTVQRWEREKGLPIHRLPGRTGRITATTTALDAWQRTAKHDSAPSHAVTCFRWPLSKQLIAELRLTGAPLTVEHLDRLRQYLDLVQASLQE